MDQVGFSLHDYIEMHGRQNLNIGKDVAFIQSLERLVQIKHKPEAIKNL
jgi:hypothetical protein